MAKILKYAQKIFGSNAGAEEIGKFGSLAAGTPEYATTPAEVQSLANYLGGWFDSVLGGNSPAIEDRNALDYLFSYQLAYLMQSGIPEWDSTTVYYIGSLVNDGTGRIYKSITDDNTNNLLSDDTEWLLVSDYNLFTKTASYTAKANELILCDTSSGAFTVTLPTAVGIKGAKIFIKVIDNTNILSLATTSSQTMDGKTTAELRGLNEYLEFTSDGANWELTNSLFNEEVISYLVSDTTEYFDGNRASGLSIDVRPGKFILDYKALTASRISGSATNTYGYLRTVIRDINDSGYMVDTASKVTKFYHDDGVTGLTSVKGSTPEPIDVTVANEYELYYGVVGSSGGSTSIGLSLAGQSDQGWGASSNNTWIRARRVGL